MTLKIAELAPMPTASVRIATAVNAGFFFSMRSAYFKSCRNVCIGRGPPKGFLSFAWWSHQMKAVLSVNTAAAGILANDLFLQRCNCRGGPPWPPQRGNTMWQTWGGHGGPPLQLYLINVLPFFRQDVHDPVFSVTPEAR